LGPNEHLIGQQGGRRALTTPAMVLDLDVFERNLETMAVGHRAVGLGLRPHAKSHKCSEMAKRQVAAGALGVCCATLREAEAMAAAGVPGVLVTSPVIGAAPVERLARLNGVADGLMVVVDNSDNAEALDAASGKAGKPLSVLVDLDIGMARTGAADGESAAALVRQVAGSGNLEYQGVQAYSGRVQHIEAYDERAAEYGGQLDRLQLVLARLAREGLAAAIVTGGGTGTHAIDRACGLFTEQQAGSYVFMDVQYNAVELARTTPPPFETALTIRCTVVSANARGFVTVNGGFKCFATDGPPPQIASGAPDGARFEYFGDEHGRIVFADTGDVLDVGDQIELVTPHCDPTVNLHDFIHCVRGETLAAIWRVDGRGVL
jgi:D-serine deaminase-like pyridoxal phosphate-dependent protein